VDKTAICWVMLAIGLSGQPPPGASTGSPSLDFDVFRTKIQPIFVATPDGKTAYVSNAVTDNVSVIDIATMKEVARIAVGYVPKRSTTGILQQ
jgi:YVTN family beta-propeller protein